MRNLQAFNKAGLHIREMMGAYMFTDVQSYATKFSNLGHILQRSKNYLAETGNQGNSRQYRLIDSSRNKREATLSCLQAALIQQPVGADVAAKPRCRPWHREIARSP